MLGRALGTSSVFGHHVFVLLRYIEGLWKCYIGVPTLRFESLQDDPRHEENSRIVGTGVMKAFGIAVPERQGLYLGTWRWLNKIKNLHNPMRIILVGLGPCIGLYTYSMYT